MTAAELGPGTLIAAYRIVELITSDGTSETYRAMQLEHDRPVALTVLRGSAAADPDLARRVAGEAATLQGLDHSAIVAVTTPVWTRTGCTSPRSWSAAAHSNS